VPEERVRKVEPLRLRTWPLRSQGIINSAERYGFIQCRDVGDDIQAEVAVGLLVVYLNNAESFPLHELSHAASHYAVIAFAR
jgi:hypothetical protein